MPAAALAETAAELSFLLLLHAILQVYLRLRLEAAELLFLVLLHIQLLNCRSCWFFMPGVPASAAGGAAAHCHFIELLLTAAAAYA
jgi:hypothetical protein